MKKARICSITLMVLGIAAPTIVLSTPDMECVGAGSQVEISECLSTTLENVDSMVEATYQIALASAQELDEITGREVAVPALEQAQEEWRVYRDSQCNFVGATYGGGSGTGIAIQGCQIEHGRRRADELLRWAR